VPWSPGSLPGRRVWSGPRGPQQLGLVTASSVKDSGGEWELRSSIPAPPPDGQGIASGFQGPSRRTSRDRPCSRILSYPSAPAPVSSGHHEDHTHVARCFKSPSGFADKPGIRNVQLVTSIEACTRATNAARRCRRSVLVPIESRQR
jgi:hypothetical protein